jgi:hypothetical protein
MPAWVWVLLGLSALGFCLWWLERETGLDATEEFGTPLAILLIAAVLVVLLLSFATADWR